METMEDGWGVHLTHRSGSPAAQWASFLSCPPEMPWRRESSLPFMASSSLSSVQLLTRAQLFVTPWTAARQASLTIINSRSLLKLMSTESGMPSKSSYPLSLSSPIALNLSQHQGLFKWTNSPHQVAQVFMLQLQASALLMNIQDLFPLEITGLICLLSKGFSRVFCNTAIRKH